MIALFIPIAGVVMAASAFFAMELNAASEKIPRLGAIMESVDLKPTRILSADGVVLYESVSEFRIPVDLGNVPKKVIDATLAAEDKRFYSHNGIDPWAIARQAFTNVREQRVAGGASTLTMQLAKRIYTSPDQTVQRKVQDAALALQMERSLTKNQILELYLNQVFYGSGAFGIAAAAETYFRKSLDELTLGEAAMLARIVRRPSVENPFVNLERSIQNRNVVLDIMLEERMITPEEHAKARAEVPKLAEETDRRRTTIRQAPYFVRYILDQVREELGPEVTDGGFTIETTLDTRLQRHAEARAARLVRTYRRSGVSTAALMVMNRSGEILSMVGGANFQRNQFNAVTQGRRQPGSAFKPLVYAAAFEQGVLTPSDGIRADTFTMKDGDSIWTVEGRRAGGMVSVRSAIAYSMNPPAVRAMLMVKPKVFVEGYARNVFGLTTPIESVPSMVLGSVPVRPIELAEAYTVFMNSGDRVRPFGIRLIRDQSGRVIRRYEGTVFRNVLSTGSSEEMDFCLREVVTGGTGTNASSVKRARGKTGTTNDNLDAWFVGYTDNYLAVVWVANEQFDSRRKQWEYRPMSDYVMGGRVPILLWRDVMREAQDLFGEPAVRPDPDDVDERRRERYVTEDGETSERITREMGAVQEAPEDTGGGEPAVSSVDQPPPSAPAEPSPSPAPDQGAEPALPDGNTDLPEDPGSAPPPGAL